MTPRPARLLWLVDSLGMGGAESLTVPFVTNVDRLLFPCFGTGAGRRFRV